MSTNDIDKAYVSPYDKFLYGFDASHNKSESQLEEIKKHKRIAELRDNKQIREGQGEIWEEF
jgi:hypothetical protein